MILDHCPCGDAWSKPRQGKRLHLWIRSCLSCGRQVTSVDKPAEIATTSRRTRAAVDYGPAMLVMRGKLEKLSLRVADYRARRSGE